MDTISTTRKNAYLGITMYGATEFYSMDVDFHGSRTKDEISQLEWVQELEELSCEEDRMEWAESGPAELTSWSPLSWPAAPVDEMKDINAAALKVAIFQADAAHEIAYGKDERIVDLMCHETIVDIRLGLWRADRFLQLRQRVFDYFDLYNAALYDEVICVAEKLMDDHRECGEQCDPQIRTIFERSVYFVENHHLDKSAWE